MDEKACRLVAIKTHREGANHGRRQEEFRPSKEGQGLQPGFLEQAAPWRCAQGRCARRDGHPAA